MQSNTNTLGNFTIQRDGYLDQEYLEAITRQERKEQLRLAGQLAIQAMQSTVHGLGKGIIAVYQHIEADANGRNTIA